MSVKKKKNESMSSGLISLVVVGLGSGRPISVSAGLVVIIIIKRKAQYSLRRESELRQQFTPHHSTPHLAL